jgi:outer membrane murein-binding lipoprotein Lpp
MTMIRTTGFLAGTITLAFTSIAGAADSNTSIDSLRAELNELRSQNDALAARVDAQDSEWLNEERAGEIRGLVQDVLADSQSRTSLQDSGMMAGYKAGKGFYLSNQDGSFSLMMSGQLQVRWVMNNNTDRGDTNADENLWGFQVRRAKVRFQGNVVDPSWTYAINGSFEGPENTGGLFFDNGTQSNGGTFEFQEAFIAKEMENGLTLTFGQFKTPWMREELVDSSQQLAVERSVINEFYNQDRAVGIMASYATDSWNFAASYNNGQQTALSQGTRYTNFTNNPTDWAFSGRFEYKFSGDWSDFDSFTSSPGDEEAIMAGVAFMGQKYGAQASDILVGLAPTALEGTTVWGVTADVSAKFGGFSFFGAFVYQSYEWGEDFGVNADNWNPWGMTLQAGYSLNDEWEIFARYSDGNSDGGATNVLNLGNEGGNPSILTVGANYFVNDNVKFTVDWGINFADNMSIFANNSSNTGWTASDESDQWVLRAQLQLLF